MSNCKLRVIAWIWLAVFVAGCGDSPAPTSTSTPTSTPAPAVSEAVVTPPESVPQAPPVNTPSSDTNAAGLDLARRSGCLVCHQIDKKVVGPAWRDVAIRYRDDPSAEARLIAKVTEGGKGNWTEVTGGVAMPPYGTRVAPGDIATLVKFVLSLK